MKTIEEIRKEARRLEALADIVENLEEYRDCYKDKDSEYSITKYEAYEEVIELIRNAVK